MENDELIIKKGLQFYCLSTRAHFEVLEVDAVRGNIKYRRHGYSSYRRAVAEYAINKFMSGEWVVQESVQARPNFEIL